MSALAAGEKRTKAQVYGTETCIYCVKTKNELNLRGIPFDFININEIGKTAAEVTGRPVTSVPQIYIEGEYIGGFTQMMKYFENEIENGDECAACEG